MTSKGPATSADATPTDAHEYPSTWRMLRRVLDRAAQRKLVLAALISMVLALMETAAIVIVLPVVNLATGAPFNSGILGILWDLFGRPDRTLYGLILVLFVVITFIGKDVATMVFNWWQSGFIARQRAELSTRLFRAVMREDYTRYRLRSVSESYRTMTAAVSQVYGSVVGGMINMVSAGLTVVAIVVALLVTTPVQALIALIFFGAAALSYVRFVKPKLTAAGQQVLDGSVEMTLGAMQGLNGFKEIKLRQSEEYFIGRFARGVRTLEQGARLGNYYSSVTKYLLEILFILGIGALLVYSFSVGEAAQAVGSLAVFVAAGFRLLPNISNLVTAVNNLRLGNPSLRLVYDELDSLDEGLGDTGMGREGLRSVAPVGSIASRETPAPMLRREIRFDNVYFRYPGGRDDVLKGIDLRIPFGSSIAFVGGSGAGKTTMVDLLLGLHLPTSGRITIDGKDMQEHRLAWQRQCAMVAQDVFVTEDSVLQNILFDVPTSEVDRVRLDDVVARSQLGDLVSTLPQGLETSAGDWGSRLSGGQKQRVGIARALYRNPRLLVLDEATSALDNETERRITDTIDALHGEVTVVVVAHRLSTVKNVDMVVFLQGGRVSGAGTFDELTRSNKDFAELVRLGDLSGSSASQARESRGQA
ncbi:ABC transporter ATP-binding protein [Brachybacterium sp. EF45031]|uniref:ABC transporter ATP-binding protein n=1 Tax=Brachybacterium sillae TaxID=2810536 RepID=UPI00217E56DC|nr:ABC transporter ATP-binding protein [Brachybacterium sillae]MCS6711620.1 ABC transporter ATP-binding protein [Brachybacterium sillae]